MPAPLPLLLAEEEWTARAEAHAARLSRWTVPHAQRRREDRSHPVLDFLFTYYSHPPGRLLRWHPGPGAALAGGAAAGRLEEPFTTEVAARRPDGSTGTVGTTVTCGGAGPVTGAAGVARTHAEAARCAATLVALGRGGTPASAVGRVASSGGTRPG